jgi:hypothetical protein
MRSTVKQGTLTLIDKNEPEILAIIVLKETYGLIQAGFNSVWGDEKHSPRPGKTPRLRALQIYPRVHASF